MTEDEAMRVLGLCEVTDTLSLKRAYRKKALCVHPDTATGTDQAFIQVKEAYETLKKTVDSKKAYETLKKAFDFTKKYGTLSHNPTATKKRRRSQPRKKPSKKQREADKVVYETRHQATQEFVRKCTEYLHEALSVGARVTHRTLGDGTVLRIEDNVIVLQFENSIGEKKFLIPDAFLGRMHEAPFLTSEVVNLPPFEQED